MLFVGITKPDSYDISRVSFLARTDGYQGEVADILIQHEPASKISAKRKRFI